MDRISEKVPKLVFNSKSLSKIKNLMIAVQHKSSKTQVYSFEEGHLKNKDHGFPIGSITKTLVAEYFCKRKIDLQSRLKDFETFKNKIKNTDLLEVTLYELLTHTSGLPRDFNVCIWETGDFPDREKVINYIDHLQLRTDRKGFYKYSNIGFIILGLVIEEISDLPFEEEMNLFCKKTLGFFDNVFNSSKRSIIDGFSQGEEGVIVRKFPRLQSFLFAGGAVFDKSDVQKYLSYYVSLSTSKGGNLILDKKTFTSMSTWHLDLDGVMTGASWRIIKSQLGVLYTHSGSIPGYASTIIVNPQKEYGVFLLANCDGILFPTAVDIAEVLFEIPESNIGNADTGLEEIVGNYYWMDKANKFELILGTNQRVEVKDFVLEPLIQQLRIIRTKRGLEARGGLHSYEPVTVVKDCGQVESVWIGGMKLNKVT